MVQNHQLTLNKEQRIFIYQKEKNSFFIRIIGFGPRRMGPPFTGVKDVPGLDFWAEFRA